MKALEFYSGIGGLHYALDQVRPGATVVALDINDLANFVYEHNFGTKPVQTNISTVTAKQLDKWAAEVWLMSPPCQPYTRRGLKKQSADARATSFLGILELIPKLEHPPKYLLVENVVGFETSDTRQELAVTLLGAGYELQEFIVTPSQLGIPYSRPRYFALAKRGDGFLLPTPPEGQGPLRQPPSQLLAAQLSTRQPLEQSIQEGQQQQQLQQQHHNGTQSAAAESSGHMCSSAGTAGERQASAQPLPATAPAAVAARVRPLGDFLVDSPAAELAGGVKAKLPNLSGLQRAGAAIGRRSGPELEQGPQSSALGAAENGKTFRAADAAAIDAAGEGHEVQPREQAQQAAMEAGQLGDAWEAFRVPEDVVRKHGRCFDLVSALSTTCNCFTKTYGQYVKGSGSLIATSNLHILRELEEEEEEQLAAGTSEQREAGGSVAAELAEGVSRAALVGAPEGDVGAPLDIQDAEVNTMAGTGGRAGPTQGQHAEQRQGRTWPSVLEEGQQASQQATPPSTNASAALFDSLQLLGLRYFTPREIANLHSFPADFSFPPSVTLRQRYALLGNSLSVAVVADLLAYLFLEH